ncbi:2-amino-4-hydroxy-6-hydroxymethyldihydropteridine diphosphokinase [Aerolutibacter ruishenii]|uniref:2-amino-4-hydroxy-6-hydroxymethyldihydropteridine pyrophosphokinase n=1 Tax=Aerolutibacter ruishenii TaxID=686800 RepID=A0A562LY19_9GAMM|nr:2-amino-4-hydroxy-6-hydroxymethyldihydropteridine diphosphokinase [Lysobacter ruishenii]TWI12537.1 2-amino-4-hydroxy-6-hydroxymethyldihydropteridine diphosphokinase [Lysobacter ruishenii]
MPVLAVIGLGGNIGDAAAAVRTAFHAIGQLPGTRAVRCSRLYRTPAWGVTAQADFVNAAVLVETTLAPLALLQALLQLEREAGRERSADGSDRWGPRTLDLDLLLYGEAAIDLPGLRVPHPRLAERAFALVPLVEVAPDAIIPGVGPAAHALAALVSGDIQVLEG